VSSVYDDDVTAELRTWIAGLTKQKIKIRRPNEQW